MTEVRDDGWNGRGGKLGGVSEAGKRAVGGLFGWGTAKMTEYRIQNAEFRNDSRAHTVRL